MHPSTTPTTTDLMAPARVVIDFTDGSHAIDAVIPPTRVPALLALMEAATNKRAVWQSDQLHYDCGSSQPSVPSVSQHLLYLTDLLSSLAHAQRSARWNSQPVPPLRDEFFPRDDGSGIGRSWGVISHLVWIQDAAEKLNAPGSAQTRAEVMAVIQAANRYPNISPRTEIKLASKGHTTAEHLVLLACTAAKHMAETLEQVEGTVSEQLRRDARQAQTLLTEAQTVIHAGVAHSLERAALQ